MAEEQRDAAHDNARTARVITGHPLRGTQSFVGTLSSVWQRPSLTALEVLWRWAFGVPALAIIFWRVKHVFALATQGSFDLGRMGLDRAFLNDPVGALSADPTGAAAKVVEALARLRAQLAPLDYLLAGLLLVVWVIVSALGRTAVMRRADPGLQRRTATLMGLQAIRSAVLLGLIAVWLFLLTRYSQWAVAGPLSRGEEPNLVFYCALVIVTSIGMFTAWAFANWIFSVAPLAAMVNGLGMGASLRSSVGLGALRGKLVEINLVLGIVKIALVVLAMVFSATPIPFESVASQAFLAWWWAGVTVLYLLWSDFFHVTRLVGYLELWRVYERKK